MSVTVTIELEALECHSCGAVYGLVSNFVRVARERGQGHGWHCPHCQASSAFVKGEAERLRGQLAAARDREASLRADLKRKEAQRRAQKAAATKLRKRAAAGVCPCCNRTFANLQRHMSTKHPDYAE